MNTVKIDRTGTSVRMIAHRGVSGLETENTASAFVAAGNRSYFGIETDVHVTKDGRFIIHHDDSTGRVAGEDQDYVIEETGYDVLRALVQKDKDGGERTRKDLILPSLREYIRICRKYEKTAVLELKNRIQRNDIVRLLEEIREEGWLERTVFISCSYENLTDLRDLLPDAVLQFLTWKPADEELLSQLLPYRLDLDILWSSLTEEGLRLMHENGVKVNVWTVDGKDDAEKLASWGVDYITSNILE